MNSLIFDISDMMSGADKQDKEVIAEFVKVLQKSLEQSNVLVNHIKYMLLDPNVEEDYDYKKLYEDDLISDELNTKLTYQVTKLYRQISMADKSGVYVFMYQWGCYYNEVIKRVTVFPTFVKNNPRMSIGCFDFDYCIIYLNTILEEHQKYVEALIEKINNF